MEARKTGGSWLAAFCMAVFLLTAFTAGAWAGDAAAFLSKTYPDNSTIAGGTAFTQSWTVRNSGTTTWTSAYKLRWISGSLNSNHTDIPISGTVAPGANYTFSVSMRTPAASSSAITYRDNWKFINPSGTTLNTFWAQIVVPAASDDHGNGISTATAVNVNTSRAGVINYGGDYDYFRIVAPSNGTLTVYTTGSTDTYGYLKNSSGTDLASNDDYNGSVNFRISQSVTVGTTYYVAVRNYYSTGTGSYTFYAGFAASAPSDDHGNSISAATTVNVNSSTAGTINYAGDYDYFRVSVPSSGTLTVYTTGSTDTYGYLKNSSGSDLASNDDQLNGDINFRISQSVSAGTYYVAVRHYSSAGTGYYTLSVSFTATSTNLLNVPYLKQQSIPVIGQDACASASAAMILAYHKKIGSTQQDMISAAQDVWNKTGSKIGAGLQGNIQGLMSYFIQKGFSSANYDESLWPALYETIKTEIRNGRPMILRSTESLTIKGHYIVVIGYEGEDYQTGKVIVNDPNGRWNGVVNNYSTSISGAGLRYSFTAITSSYKDGVFIIRP